MQTKYDREHYERYHSKERDYDGYDDDYYHPESKTEKEGCSVACLTLTKQPV
jgi:hypothetical protein